MNEKTYNIIREKISSYQYGVTLLKGVNKFISLLTYCLYPLLLIGLIYKKDSRFWKTLLVPAFLFILVTIFRRYYNAARPYELLDIQPLIEKDSRGNSFPSRHVFSIYIIAMAFYYIYPPLGLVFMFLGGILALTRVLGGVHFPKDVIAGALIGILGGIIGFIVF